MRRKKRLTAVPLIYFKNAKEILKKAEPDYEIGIYGNIKYVQEAFGTLWFAILKAIDYALTKKGIPEKDLPQDWEIYKSYISKYLTQKDGKLLKLANSLYKEIHIAGYYRGLLEDINRIKDIFKDAEKFIKKLM